MTGLVAEPLVKQEVEVVGKAERRRFTAAYKRRVVQEADRCRKPGEVDRGHAAVAEFALNRVAARESRGETGGVGHSP